MSYLNDIPESNKIVVVSVLSIQCRSRLSTWLEVDEVARLAICLAFDLECHHLAVHQDGIVQLSLCQARFKLRIEGCVLDCISAELIFLGQLFGERDIQSVVWIVAEQPVEVVKSLANWKDISQ